METEFAYYNTTFGIIEIGYNKNVIVSISFSQKASQSTPSFLTEKTILQLNEYFNKKRTSFDIPIEPKGTVFQKKVWNALLKIPYGQTKTYKEIAEIIGNKNATRAVGMANNKNPIAIVIPCHRVIGANGKLTGYAGGLDKKEKLLLLEK